MLSNKEYGKVSVCYSFLEFLKLNLFCSMSVCFLASLKCAQNGTLFCLHFSALLR